ncbi:CheR family methyltransferase [Flavilitoribacter nigricans]|uniref:Uncharacterized protein n=1 Tax=Flavilitoribacter nigricans (strain ATCC 23147 / DSM 23189 / NBRC 102662 / NCIMB 1420 / SS-2) TaxID=1122177 RepID=A0A2D0N1L6_FLAN2|nr:chemotaxis protein CheB [Flavilitoribacter nigricans]PHN02357.1 hypothetical protein CRP01_32450 [Flavilitoribacter nigricans DSM 23189 = NBRC 102662]
MKNKESSFLIVGIGASAGGLAVLKDFVRSLPAQTRMAFIIVQHLDPDYKSLLPELLDKESPISVSDAEHDQEIEADHIYVIPSNTYLEIKDRKLKLVTPTENRGHRKAIDHFFRSLAEECESQCAGIVVSGSGSDGTAGLRAIKAAGGLVLAQLPETAEHDSMPQSAIDAGIVDKVVRVDKMYQVLQQYLDHPLTLRDEEEEIALNAENSLEEITAILKTHENFNLQQYKPSTVQRRIARRMSLTNIDDYKTYLERLRNIEEERKLLTKDLLINVTDFFRDPEAFEVLEKKVIPNIVSKLEKEQPVRIWIAGCASGEEAYSIAILFLEERGKQRKSNPIKIFATDIDEQAIKIARKGVYPESIAREMPKKFLEKYFTITANSYHYRINNQVRDLISFAIQNSVIDPPFSHMHLISCRNLLIYLKKEMQEKVLGAFYFALNEDGYLFLGSSETITSKQNSFKTLSKKWRVYQKIPGREDTRRFMGEFYSERTNKPAKRESLKKIKGAPSRSDLIRRAMLENILPPGVIVDQEGTILYNHGNWSDYLALSTGEPRNDIIQLIKPDLRSRLRSALYKVKKSKEMISFKVPVAPTDAEGKTKMVRVELTPLLDQEFAEGEAIAIIFYEVLEQENEFKQSITQDDEMKVNQNLERELAETKEELQNTIEELETSTEELKASHEEALSTNEELQSANEELEASAEELRSLNEELNTVNLQLKEKVDQLQSANDDLENFFSSANVPTIFLDPDLRIQRYTPAAERLLKLGPADIGRPISFLRLNLVDESLVDKCREVLENFQPVREEIQGQDDRWFIRQITPYRAEERRIEGVVLVFHDVTELKQLSRRAEVREEQQAAVAKLGMTALGGAAPETLIEQAVRQVAYTLNVEFCKVLEYQPEKNNLLLVAGVGWQEGLVGRATVPSDQNSQAGYTLISREPVIVKRLQDEKRFKGPSLLLDHKVVSGLSCLINHQDPPFGILSIHTSTYREFSKDDANFLLSVANLISTALLSQKTQEQLKISQERLNMARIAGKIGIHDHDIRKDTVIWDDFTRQLWGVPPDVNPITYQIFNEGLHPDDREPTRQIIEEALKGKNNGELRVVYRVINRKDQKMRWVEATGKTIYDGEEPVRMVGTVQDITDHIKANERLVSSERKLRIAMGSNNLGAFEFSFVEDLTEWDEVVKRLWGIPENGVPTLNIFWDRIHPDDVSLVQEKFAKATQPQSGGKFHAIFRVIHPDGQKNWVEASGQTLFEQEKAARMVGMIMDVTDRKELETSLRLAVTELKASDHRKNEFLSILGHELRNPLASLTASIEVLEMDPETTVRIFGIMKRNVNTMGKLLDDLLDLSRIAQDKILLESKPVNLSGLLNDIADTVSRIYTGNQRKFLVELEEGIVVTGDRVRLEQAFTNLLVNSFKFTTDEDTIRLTLTTKDDVAEVKISDTGIGIEAEALDKVFKPFFQEKKPGKASSGLGIGLALSKDFIELQNGNISVQSEGQDMGTTFTINLPISEREKTLPPKREDVDFSNIRAGLKILLIEDNEDIRLMIPLMLQPIDCEIRTAETGMEGLKVAEAFEPEVMFIDIGLPDIDGHEVASRLRANGYKGLLVALSGYSHQEIKEKSKAVGFDHHLSKPANLTDFVELLAKVD